jgi:hypothetical protein
MLGAPLVAALATSLIGFIDEAFRNRSCPVPLKGKRAAVGRIPIRLECDDGCHKCARRLGSNEPACRPASNPTSIPIGKRAISAKTCRANRIIPDLPGRYSYAEATRRIKSKARRLKITTSIRALVLTSEKTKTLRVPSRIASTAFLSMPYKPISRPHEAQTRCHLVVPCAPLQGSGRSEAMRGPAHT